MRDNGPLEWETPMGYSDDQLPGLSGTFPSDPWTSSGYQQTDIGVAPEGNHARGVVFGLHMDSRQSISADAAPQSGTLMDYQLGLDNCSGEPVPSNEQPPSDNVGQSFGW